jgi:CHAT domain-containing protein
MVTAPTAPPVMTDARLVEQLVSLDDVGDVGRFLWSQRACITPDVIKRLKDKVAHFIRADIPRAAHLAAAARAAATLIDDPEANAVAHHAMALVRHFSGRYSEALADYEQAQAIYDRLDNRVESARIGRAKLDVLMYLGRYEEALAVGMRACQVFRQHGCDVLLAQTQENMGNVYHRLDRYEEALAYYQRALKIYATGGQDFNIGSVSYNAANVYVCLNEFEQALALYQQAKDVYERLAMPLLVNQADYSMAWLYFQRGRFQDSLRLFARVRARARELGDPAQDALCDLDLAEVYWHLNAYQEACEAAQSAIEKFQALGMRYEQIKAAMYLGMAHLRLHHVVEATSALAAAREGFLLEGNNVFTAVTNLSLSELFAQQKNWDSAEALCVEANAMFREQGLTAKAAYAELQRARIKLFRGDIAQARQLGESALAAMGDIEAPRMSYQALHFMGRMLEQTGEPDQAYHCYTRAVEQVEQLRHGIRVEQLACAFIHDKLSVYEDLVQLCSQRKTEDMIEAAFTYAEASKSRALIDLLSQAGAPVERKVSTPASDELLARIETLREQLNWRYTRIEQLERQGKVNSSRVLADLHTAARTCERQLAQLIQQLRIEDAEYSSLYSVSPVDVAAVRNALADDEALVEYYIVNGRVKVFVLTRDGIHLVNDITTPEQVSSLMRPLRHSLNQCTLADSFVQTHHHNRQAFTDSCLKKLHAELIAPIESLIEGKKLLFIPHGVLHGIPFHALHDGQGYLIDRHEISYCPSAGVYKLCVDKANQLRKAEGRRQKAEGRRRKAEGVSSSLNNPQSAIRHPQSGGVFIMGIPDEAAPHVSDEVATLKSLWPDANVVVGPEATLARLKRDGSGSRLIHLATHATFRPDHPLFSAMKLADGWLSFYDIFNLNLQADLVTLSACETGLNGVYPGDELFGLMRGFLYAGAPSLIVSSWMVKDRSTAAFMAAFYAGLRWGLNKRTALRAAQLDIKQQHPHPYYWAPFVLMGAPV